MAIDGPPAVAAEPRVRPVRPAELETLLPGRGRDVHRGGRRQPAPGRRRRRLPRAGRRAGAGRAVAGLDRGRRGAVQGRDRRGLPRRLPDPGRLGRPRATAAGASGRRAPRPWSSTPARSIAPVVSLYVNDFNAAGPRRLPAGRASARSGSTPACCSETVAVPSDSLSGAVRTRRGPPPSCTSVLLAVPAAGGLLRQRRGRRARPPRRRSSTTGPAGHRRRGREGHHRRRRRHGAAGADRRRTSRTPR